MIRTQVYLPKTLYQQIDLTAKRERKAKAAVIRELLGKGLTNKKPRETARDAFLKLAAIGGKGPADLSKNLDDYLYGDKK